MKSALANSRIKDIIPCKHNIVIFFIFIFFIFPGVRDWFFNLKFGWSYVLSFSFLVSYLCVPVVRRIALRLDIVDNPDRRKIHVAPTPLLGGVAVYIAFASAIIYNNVFSLELKGVAIGATIVFIIGLIDDFKFLPAMLKLFIQVVAVSIMICYGVVVDILPNVWWGKSLEIVITIIWMLGITNSLNFFDGMDGLAAGLTVICSMFLGILAIQTNQPYLMFLSIALVGSCLGFLPFNLRYKKPAVIFLGDAGSTFMGFMLAGMVVMGGWGSQDPIKAYAMPILIMGIFIFDMTYTTIARISSKKVVDFGGWVEYAGRDHLHHRLTDLGLSAKKTVFFYLLSYCIVRIKRPGIEKRKSNRCLIASASSGNYISHSCHIDVERETERQEERRSNEIIKTNPSNEITAFCFNYAKYYICPIGGVQSGDIIPIYLTNDSIDPAYLL
ncbi:MAG: putative glycosyltransferase [Candidatus Scalindua rubra]|uniref:Putative glycosyltransferase n=1 Tax=Candidatus Scalindua rubra TaxID=1872076 RepID=A0A1E3X927_9BACT|nr:MAG: putative glycosyltransferase [Candidatus Scalindua rubra]